MEDNNAALKTTPLIPEATKPPVAKPAPREIITKASLAVLFLLVVVYLGNKEKQTPGIHEGQINLAQIAAVEASLQVPASPVRLTIPIIQVDAAIQYVGLTADNAMDVPSNITDVGWFDQGTRPGEIGSAVIDGHFNGKNGETGVFSNLNKLKTGDKLYIKNDQGISITFIVRKIRTYNPGYAEEVFNQTDGAHLNLITCDGAWDFIKQTYSQRLVVFADKE